MTRGPSACALWCPCGSRRSKKKSEERKMEPMAPKMVPMCLKNNSKAGDYGACCDHFSRWGPFSKTNIQAPHSYPIWGSYGKPLAPIPIWGCSLLTAFIVYIIIVMQHTQKGAGEQFLQSSPVPFQAWRELPQRR